MQNPSMLDDDLEAPTFGPFRIVHVVSRALGSRFVKDSHVRVIYRNGLYYTAKGPGHFWIRFWSDRTGAAVYIGPRFQAFTFANLSARDPVRIGLKVSAGFSFDPRRTTPTTAAQFISAPQDPVPLIVSTALLKSLRMQVSQYAFEHIRLGQIFDVIEQRAQADLEANPLLGKLGIKTSSVIILEPLFPESLETRFEESAQLRFNVEAAQEYLPSELAKTLAIEIVERLNRQGGGEQYLNPGDILNVVQQLPSAKVAAPTMIEGQATPVKPTPVAEQTAALRSAPPKPPVQSQPAPGPISPSYADEDR